MESPVLRHFTAADGAVAVAVALVCIVLGSLLAEPTRRRFMAIVVAGAGAAYLNGGLGFWEIPFTVVATVVAYRGLEDHRFIGAGWLLHVGWDIVHHLQGHPILFFLPTSSAQCAVTDTLVAAWFFVGAPRVWRRAPAGALRGQFDSGP